MLGEGGTFSVLLVSHAYSEASLQRQVAAIDRHVNVTLLVPERTEVLLFRNYQASAVGHRKVLATRTIKLFRSQFFFRSLSLGLTGRPDVVHIDYDPWQVMFWQVRLTALFRSPSSRIVVGCKKNTFNQKGVRAKVKLAAGWIGFRVSERVVASSRMTARTIERVFGVGKEKLAVSTHVGVDTSRFVPAVKQRGAVGPVVIGYCGRLAPHKGLDDLITGVDFARRQGFDLRLRIMGVGPMEEELAKLAGASPWLSLEPAVPTSEVVHFLQGVDVFALPARRLPDHEEHDAHALIQAMACGLAVVGSRSGIIPEIIDDWSNGVLIEPGSVDALSSAIMALAESAETRENLGRCARNTACERFDYQIVAEEKVAAYADVMSSKAGSRIDGWRI